MQFLVNGQPVLIKGANRHEIDPDGGYVLSMERMIQELLKIELKHGVLKEKKTKIKHIILM